MDQGMVWEKLLKVILRENIPEMLLFIFMSGITISFYKPFTDLLQRLFKIDMDKKTAHFTPQAGNVEFTNLEGGNTYESGKKLLNAVGNSEVLLATVEYVENDLKNQKLSPLDEREVLIKYLAASTLAVAFEEIYDIIFGSQISLLQQLQDVRQLKKPGGVREVVIKNVEKIINDHKELSGATPEQYLKFLKDRSLLFDKDGYIGITDIGIEFLSWMVKKGRSPNKLS